MTAILWRVLAVPLIQGVENVFQYMPIVFQSHKSPQLLCPEPVADFSGSKEEKERYGLQQMSATDSKLERI